MRQKRSRSRVHLSAGPERLPSPGAPRVTLARAVQDPPPCSGLCRHGAGFRRLVHLTPARAELKLDLPRDPGLITPGRAGQTPPVDFCNHHGSQARPRKPDPLTLHAPQRVTPLRSATAGSPALARERRPSCLESRGRHGLTSTPAPLRTMTRRRALPRTDRPGHLMSQKRARTQPEKPDAEVRDVVPTFPPSKQRTRRRPYESPRSAHFREEDPGPRTRGAFLYDGQPEGRRGIHKLLPACGLVARRLCPAVCPFQR